MSSLSHIIQTTSSRLPSAFWRNAHPNVGNLSLTFDIHSNDVPTRYVYTVKVLLDAQLLTLSQPGNHFSLVSELQGHILSSLKVLGNKTCPIPPSLKLTSWAHSTTLWTAISTVLNLDRPTTFTALSSYVAAHLKSGKLTSGRSSLHISDLYISFPEELKTALAGGLVITPVKTALSWMNLITIMTSPPISGRCYWTWHPTRSLHQPVASLLCGHQHLSYSCQIYHLVKYENILSTWIPYLYTELLRYLFGTLWSAPCTCESENFTYSILPPMSSLQPPLPTLLKTF